MFVPSFNIETECSSFAEQFLFLNHLKNNFCMFIKGKKKKRIRKKKKNKRTENLR